jgi:hypothetical protein
MTGAAQRSVLPGLHEARVRVVVGAEGVVGGRGESGRAVLETDMVGAMSVPPATVEECQVTAESR